MGNRIILTTANAGQYVAPRTLPAHIRAGKHAAYVMLMLKGRIAEEARAGRKGGVTVRAWEVTPAGTYLYPPVAELTA